MSLRSVAAGPAAALALLASMGTHAGAADACIAAEFRCNGFEPNWQFTTMLDAGGNPVPGVAVTLEPSAGSLADSSVVTDSLGRVAAKWTLGRTPGAHTLTVRASELP